MRKTRSWTNPFKQLAGLGQSWEACWAPVRICLPVGPTGWYCPGLAFWLRSKLKYHAALKAKVPRCPQVPRRRVNNFQLANVMEPQSSPPAPPPTPAPAPGSNADILVDDSVSNAPATRPASVAATSAMANSQETEESLSMATSKKRKLTSQVWDHFKKIIQGLSIFIFA